MLKRLIKLTLLCLMVVGLGLCFIDILSAEAIAYCGNAVCETGMGENETNCPWDCHNHPDYAQYFINNPGVMEAFVENLDQEAVNYFWNYIDNLESYGEITIPEPAELAQCNPPDECPYIYLSDQEMKKILAAKAAHAIWLDKNNYLSWNLMDYSDSELEELFKKEMLFLYSGSQYYYSSLVDYSPSDAYEYANQFVQNDALNTAYAIINDLREDFRHGISGSDPVDTAYSLKDALTEYYVGKRVSRHGCQTMSDIVIGLLRSISIPSYEDWGWYAGAGHSSAFFSGIERILIHGDDIYSQGLRATPTNELLMTFDYFYNNVYPCGKFTECAEYETLRFNALNATTYISDYTIDCCCNLSCRCGDNECDSCEEYFQYHYGEFLTQEELQDTIARTLDLCEIPCSIIVDSPAEGDEWWVGSTETIRWTSSGAGNYVKIELGQPVGCGGYNCSTITSRTSNTGSYPWTVQGEVQNYCTIRVCSLDHPDCCWLSEYFDIKGNRPPSKPTITFSKTRIEPGEWVQFCAHSTDPEGDAIIYHWKVVDPNGEIYESSVDEECNPTPMPIPGSYTFYCTAEDEYGAQSVRAVAILVVGTITVTSPASGEDWESGSTETIEWTSSGFEGNVKIELGRHTGCGRIWSTIASSTSNDGSHNWTAQGPAQNNCIIRITSIDIPAIFGDSGSFDIVSPTTTSSTTTIPNQPPTLHSFSATSGDYYANQQIVLYFNASDDHDSSSQLTKKYQVWIYPDSNDEVALLQDWTVWNSSSDRYTIPWWSQPGMYYLFRGQVWDTGGLYSYYIDTEWHAIVATYSISGNIKDHGGANLPGIVACCLSVHGIPYYFIETDSNGNYQFSDLPDGSAWIIYFPFDFEDYTFVPETRTVMINGSNVTGQNFTAYPN